MAPNELSILNYCKHIGVYLGTLHSGQQLHRCVVSSGAMFSSFTPLHLPIQKIGGRAEPALLDQRLQHLGRDVLDVGDAGIDLLHLARLHVNAGDPEPSLCILDRQRQTDIAQPDDTDVRRARFDLLCQLFKMTHDVFGFLLEIGSGARRVPAPETAVQSPLRQLIFDFLGRSA